MSTKTLERAKCSPEEAVYVDDIPDYVTATESLGIIGILYNSQEEPPRS